MNNMQYPYFPSYQSIQQINLENEIKILKYEIQILKDKIQKLDNKSQKNYLQKEEGKYIM